MDKKTEGISNQNKALIGAGLAALAAAAAGAIFFYGTETGRKKRKEIESWVLRMKADILDQMESMKEWSEESYASVVDSVAKKYEQMKNLDPVEIAALAQELKKHWKTITQYVEGKNKSKNRRPTKRKTSKK